MVVNDALSAIDEPLILATIASLAVDADELNADIGAADEPLIFVTNTSLAVEALPLNMVVDSAYEAVTAYDDVSLAPNRCDAVNAYDADIVSKASCDREEDIAYEDDIVSKASWAKDDDTEYDDDIASKASWAKDAEVAENAVWANDELISCLISTDDDTAYDAVRAYDADAIVRFCASILTLVPPLLSTNSSVALVDATLVNSEIFLFAIFFVYSSTINPESSNNKSSPISNKMWGGIVIDPEGGGGGINAPWPLRCINQFKLSYSLITGCSCCTCCSWSRRTLSISSKYFL